MRVHYCDTGLATNLGHHANSARLIVGELRRRGIETIVHAYRHVHPDLVDELEARPTFAINTYAQGDHDPLIGWMLDFHNKSCATLNDLKAIDFDEGDIVYFNSIQAPQLSAIGQLDRSLGNERGLVIPTIAEFGVDPGLDVTERAPNGSPSQYGTRDPRVDPRAVLYRLASVMLGDSLVSLNTFEPWSSAAYSSLLNREVGVLPVPREAHGPLRSRVGANPITVGILGHQRGEKGWQLVPDIVRLVLQRCPNVRFLLHNGDPGFMADVQEQVRELGRQHARVDVDERLADAEIWQDLLDACDLIVCPYEPSRFALSYSAVVAEAIANGIPVVVPENTAMHRMIDSSMHGCFMFAGWDAHAVSGSVITAVELFEHGANANHKAALRWKQHHGAKPLVSAILSKAGYNVPCEKPDSAGAQA